MKAILLPIILASQICGLILNSQLVDARQKEKLVSRYNYGHNLKGGRGPPQGQTEYLNGVQSRGNYYVNLPNSTGQSKVQYVADNQGYQTVVRINTKNARSQVSSHFAMGKEAVNALKKMNSSDYFTDDMSNKLLTNEIMPESEMIFVTAPAIQPHAVTAKPSMDKGLLRLINNTSDMVSDEDVFSINGAAEEYFDDISEEKLKQSRFTFADEFVNAGYSQFTKPVIEAEIITNSFPRTGARALSLNSADVVITPSRTNIVASSERAPTRNVNIQILKDRDYTVKFGDRISPVVTERNTKAIRPPAATQSTTKFFSRVTAKHIEVSPIATKAIFIPTVTPATVFMEQATKTTSSPPTTTLFPEINTAPGISESFLAPIQAGLLLFNQKETDKTTPEFEDNILSDSMQSDQKVLSEEIQPENSDEPESQQKQPITTLVESYRSNPIIEIIERGISNNKSTEVQEQTFIHAVETHETSETISSQKTQPPEQNQISTPELKAEKTVFIPSVPYDENNSEVPYIANHVYPPLFAPIPLVQIPVQVSYLRAPPSGFYTNHLRHYHPNSISHENCYHCINQIIKDDYYGPVPPTGEYSNWNNAATVNYRQQRQLPMRSAPKYENGFKPPMRPSLEITAEGLPLVRNYH